jgi:hypothetical protein
MGNRLCFKKKENDQDDILYQNDGEIINTSQNKFKSESHH